METVINGGRVMGWFEKVWRTRADGTRYQIVVFNAAF